MKKFLLSITVSFTLTIAAAQTNVYHPFPEDSAIWVVDLYAQPPYCNGYCSTVVYRMYGDTIINSISYNKIWSESFMWVGPWNPPYNYTPSVYNGGIRQDIPNKKVYYRSASMTSDTLLFDFDLAVGDTLPATYLTNSLPQPSIISGIDSMLVGSTYRKLFTFANTAPYQFGHAYLLEGVGAGGGLFYLLDFFEGGPILGCFRDLDTHNCEYTFVGINEQTNKALSISPNPFSTQTTLQSDYAFHYETATVYNCLGKIVKQIKNINGSSVTIVRDQLPSGLYYLKMAENNINLSVTKLIIVDN